MSLLAPTKLRHLASRGAKLAVNRGVPPAWFGYRWVRRQTVGELLSRADCRDLITYYETIHPEAIVRNPLPANVSDRTELPDDRGWWGYSFHDVPARTSTETFIATLPDAQVVWYEDPRRQFHPAVLTSDDRSLDLREIRYRRPHAEAFTGGYPVRLKRATWIVERVYDNHSHWLSAHLPKLLLLRERGQLDHVLLPPRLTPVMETSLRMLGLEPAAFSRFDPSRRLEVDQLTVMGTDRFRPELLRLVQQAVTGSDRPTPHRRIFISRAGATRRRLVNEEELWPLLRDIGFERVRMEELSFTEQVALMRETAMMFAPHGAGLTNMLFCPPGADIVEIADLTFPNPNFYAMACAAGHRYWLLAGEYVGDAPPLERDLRIDASSVTPLLRKLTTAGSAAWPDRPTA